MNLYSNRAPHLSQSYLDLSILVLQLHTWGMVAMIIADCCDAEVSSPLSVVSHPAPDLCGPCVRMDCYDGLKFRNYLVDCHRPLLIHHEPNHKPKSKATLRYDPNVLMSITLR